MKSIHVIAPGLLTTVQDLGREGYGPMGVSRSGAADALSLRLGNQLVGNAEGTTALEMTLLGGTFAFPEGAVIALAGSDFGATLDGEAVPLYTTVRLREGQTLQLGSTRSGARCYLCVQGGIQVKPFLGSGSTHLLSGLGGFDGRPLRKGDVLQIRHAAGSVRARRLSPKVLKQLVPRKVLRTTPGPQSDWFSKSSIDAFCENIYRVGEKSDRMGIRLEGQAVISKREGDMISEGVSNGAVQIPPGGTPIILFVEQQTTGGYPKIANVISADFGSLGQLRPRDEIRFEQVGWNKARALLLEQEQLLSTKCLVVE